MDCLHRPQNDNAGDLQPGEQVAETPVGAHGVAHADPQAGKLLVLLIEPGKFMPLPAKGPHHPHAGEVLLNHSGQLPSKEVAILERGPIGQRNKIERRKNK